MMRFYDFLVMCSLAVLAVAVPSPPSTADEDLGRLRIGPEVLYAKPQGRAFGGINESIPLPIEDAVLFAQRGFRSLAIEPRIIGGDPAPIGGFPWQVSIGLRDIDHLVGHFCGGAVVDARWVLTASHCVDGETTPENIEVLAGTNFLNGVRGQVVHVKRIIINETWEPSTFNNDIALLETTDPIWSTPIQLIPEGADDLVDPGRIVMVSGWGLTRAGGALSDVLRVVAIQMVSNDVCNGAASYAGAITPEMMCAGFVEGGKDSCQGDSGGPLVVPDRKGGFLLAGIVSWGEGCAEPAKYGVYTRVLKFGDWVKSLIS